MNMVTAVMMTDYPANLNYSYVFIRPDPDYVVLYDISTSAVNGTVTATVKGETATSAPAEETVTVKVAPAADYKLKDIAVTTVPVIDYESIDTIDAFVELFESANIQGLNDGTYDFSAYHVRVNGDGELAVMEGDNTVVTLPSNGTVSVQDQGFIQIIVQSDTTRWFATIVNGLMVNFVVMDIVNNTPIFAAEDATNGVYTPGKPVDLTTVKEGEEYTFKMPYDNINVKAEFEKIVYYTVTWMNGDDVLETDEKVEAGTVPTYNSAEPTKDGCTFTGWTDGENTYASDALPEVTGDVTYTAVFAIADGVGARVVGHSISLEGDIAVNFYMELDPAIAASETAYMHFTIPNGKKTSVVDVPVSQATVKGKYYVFKCNIAAKDMNATITGQIVDGETVGTEYTYSVREYADYLLDHADANGTDAQKEYAAAAPLVEKMLSYGAYAKEYFDKTDTLDALRRICRGFYFCVPNRCVFSKANSKGCLFSSDVPFSV